MLKIENEQIQIGIKTLGAELSSIIDKSTGREFMWQGDAEFWTGQAPILFPIVGELKNGETQIKGKTFNCFF